MKEYIYENIWELCADKCPEKAKSKRAARILLAVSYVYYLLMCLAYLFAMILAISYEDVTFVASGKAVNLFIMMTVFLIAGTVGAVFAWRDRPLASVIISAAELAVSPYALWNSSINFKFEINHLIAMVLLFAAELFIFILCRSRTKKIKSQYDKLLSKILSEHTRDGAMLTQSETDEILKNYDPAVADTGRPLKRSQKDRIRKKTEK